MLTPADFNKKIDLVLKSAKGMDPNGYIASAVSNTKYEYKVKYEQNLKDSKRNAAAKKLKFPGVKLNIVVDKKNLEFNSDIEGVVVCSEFVRVVKKLFPRIETTPVNVFTLWSKLEVHHGYGYKDKATEIAKKLKLTKAQVNFVNQQYPNTVQYYAGE